MPKRFTLRLQFQGEDEDLFIEVREGQSDRLAETLKMCSKSGSCGTFATFEALSGDTFALNLDYLQLVRFLWDAAPGPSDLLVSDKPVRIKFYGKPEVIESASEPEDAFAFFHDLSLGEDQFVPLLDEDGELMAVVTAQVVWASAPTLMLQEVMRDWPD